MNVIIMFNFVRSSRQYSGPYITAVSHACSLAVVAVSFLASVEKAIGSAST